MNAFVQFAPWWILAGTIVFALSLRNKVTRQKIQEEDLLYFFCIWVGHILQWPFDIIGYIRRKLR